MAKLYGRLKGAKGEVTRTGHYSIVSKLETWDGSIHTKLFDDGTFQVFIGNKYNPSHLVASGNINGRSVLEVCQVGRI